MPALILSRVSTRCAALTAFSTLSPASASRSTSLAPPSALMPPWLLISSIAMSAPIFLSWPCRAHRPDSGATSAILTSSAPAAGRAISVATTVMRLSTAASVRRRSDIAISFRGVRSGDGRTITSALPRGGVGYDARRRLRGTPRPLALPRALIYATPPKGANHDGEKGHGTSDGLGRRSGRQRGRVQPLVQRGASRRAARDPRLLERGALRSGEGRAEASRRVRAGKPGRARHTRLQERRGKSDAVDEAGRPAGARDD